MPKNRVQRPRRLGRALIFVLLPATASPAAAEVVLEPSHTFTLPAETSQALGGEAAILGMAYDSGAIWALVSSASRVPVTKDQAPLMPDRSQVVVVKLSETGENLLAEPLPVPTTSRGISAGNGAVYVADYKQIVGFGSNGAPNPRVTFQAALMSFCVLDRAAVGVSYEGDVIKLGARDEPIGRVAPDAFPTMAALPDDRFVIAHGMAGRLSFGSLGEGITKSWVLENPEFVSIRNALYAGVPPNGPKIVLISGVASGGRGSVFVALSGARAETGMTLLEFDSRGEFKGVVRCMLPLIAAYRTKGDPAGMMPPRFVSADVDRLILASSNGDFAVYDLSP